VRPVVAIAWGPLFIFRAHRICTSGYPALSSKVVLKMRFASHPYASYLPPLLLSLCVRSLHSLSNVGDLLAGHFKV
jgi:hypothetical protein